MNVFHLVLGETRTLSEIVVSVTRIIDEHLTPLPLVELAGLRIETRDDIEHWVDRMQLLAESRPSMSADQEDRLNSLRSLLLIASIRARMVADDGARRRVAA